MDGIIVTELCDHEVETLHYFRGTFFVLISTGGLISYQILREASLYLC